PSLHPAASHWTQYPRMDALLDSFEGLVLGAGLPWTINLTVMAGSFAWYRARGIRSRPLEGMGEGDSHLLGMVGALLGWKAATVTLLIGVFVGCFTGVGKIAWGALQRWRLGEKYRPWQPTFDLSAEAAPKPQAPVFWPLLAIGAVVLICGLGLWQQSNDTFSGQMFPTVEDLQQNTSFQVQSAVDWRMAPVWAMMVIGVLLFLACPFYKYLQITDNLPQGDIVENEKGEKQEVMQGNYVPFGPSLAVAALLVVFYGPLLRTFLLWWLVLGGAPRFPSMPSHVLGQNSIIRLLVGFVERYTAFLLNLDTSWWSLVLILVLVLFLGLLVLGIFRRKG
ncbi:MAG: prepilin peptidase, partial [Planctomycetota bacterium]